MQVKSNSQFYADIFSLVRADPIASFEEVLKKEPAPSPKARDRSSEGDR